MASDPNSFVLHSGLPALGGAEYLDAVAASLLSSRPIDAADAKNLADGLRHVAGEVRKAIADLRAQASAEEMPPQEALARRMFAAENGSSFDAMPADQRNRWIERGRIALAFARETPERT